jgi:hypothetical protein
MIPVDYSMASLLSMSLGKTFKFSSVFSLVRKFVAA